MKKEILLAIILFCGTIAFAQGQLIVHSSEKGPYLLHKVTPKETFYSIGRAYHISPKDIETFNGLDMNKGLLIGQVIKVPLNEANLSQSPGKGQPVYYEVQPGESLYRVSLKNNKVPTSDLRSWNHLANDNIVPGEKLVVGYLTSTGANAVAQADPVERQPEQRIEEKKEDVVVKEKPVKETVAENTNTIVDNSARVQTQTAQPRNETKTDAVASVSQSRGTNNNAGEGGYFQPQFSLQTKTQPAKTEQTASAGIFKTASGWEDRKYYALIDNVEPGTIVKVINPTNNKAVYAKVLGEMSGIRQNEGYDVRISNAAASALNVSDTEKFIVRVNY